MGTTLSVITICFNNPEELITTCNSVDQQTLLPEEHLIIDGSTNKEIINRLTSTSQPSYRKWIHEEDKGIADAFNKGIKNSTGEITHLLNAGDIYADNNAIKIFLSFFQEEPQLMWMHSNYIQHRGNIEIISGNSFDKDQLWKGMRQVAHPTMFVKKEIYDRHGFFNDQLKIAMDYDMLVRMRNEKFRYIDKPLLRFAPGGISDLQFYKGLEEVKYSYQKYIGGNTKQTLWQLRQKMLHIFMQTGIGKIWFNLKNRKKKIY